jgi:hypothetical protein
MLEFTRDNLHAEWGALHQSVQKEWHCHASKKDSDNDENRRCSHLNVPTIV